MRHLVLLVLVVPILGLPVAAQEKDKLTLSTDEKGILKLLNETRTANKLSPLTPNATLFRVARAHSANMAKQGKMDHVLDGKKPADRVLAAGYNYRIVKENLAKSDDGEEDKPYTLAEIHEGWMKSEKHRVNILNPKVKEIGIGVVRLKNGKTYYTQVFGARLGE